MTEARRIDFDIRAKHTALKTVPEISAIISALECRIVGFEAEINRYAVRTEELHKRIDEIKRELTLWTR